MKPSGSHLHLVRNGVIPFGDESLLLDADKFEAANGANLYSTFLRRHGQRPSRKQAATIGALMGVRVRATDGSLQPPLSNAEREKRRGLKDEQKEWSRRLDHIWRVKGAVESLCQNEDAPCKVVGYGIEELSEIREKLDSALEWLTRFAEELRRHEKVSGTEGEERAG